MKPDCYEIDWSYRPTFTDYSRFYSPPSWPEQLDKYERTLERIRRKAQRRARESQPIFIPVPTPTDAEQKYRDALVDIAHDTATIEGAKRRAADALK